MNYYGQHRSHLDVGEDHVTLSKAGNSGGTLAKILHKEVDRHGRVVSMVLDRVITEKHTVIEGWSHTGFVATELTRTKE